MLHVFFYQETQNIVKNITWSELNHPLLSKRSTACTREDLGRQYSILQYVTTTLDVYQICYSVGRSVTNWEFFIKPGVKLNGQHTWYILLSQRMLYAIKYIADDIVFRPTDLTKLTTSSVKTRHCSATEPEFNLIHLHLVPPLEFCRDLWHQKTRDMG